MSRGLPTSLEAAFRASTPRPIHLVEIRTGLVPPDDVIRLTDYDHDIAFPAPNGNLYKSRKRAVGAGLSFGDVTTDPSGEESGLDLRCPDKDKYFQGLIQAGARFERQLVHVMRVEKSELDGSTKRILNLYVIDHYTQADWEITFHLQTLLGILNRVEIPKGIISREEYEGIPRE